MTSNNTITPMADDPRSSSDIAYMEKTRVREEKIRARVESYETDVAWTLVEDVVRGLYSLDLMQFVGRDDESVIVHALANERYDKWDLEEKVQDVKRELDRFDAMLRRNRGEIWALQAELDSAEYEAEEDL
jgi:2-C-methyl-D-erythritol 4-phosphate cytidylyltransferase